MEKRKLSSKELNSIVQKIRLPFPNSKCNQGILNSYIQYIRDNVSKIELYTDLIPEYSKRVVNSFYQSLVPDGEPVGIISAQSLGEPTTQSALNNHRLAGVGNKYTINGLESLTRLYACSAEQKNWSCSLYLKESTFDNAMNVTRQKIMPMTCEALCKSIYVFSPDSIIREEIDNWWYSHNSNYNAEICDPYFVRMIFDLSMLYYHKITLEQIAEKLSKEVGILVYYSPMTIGEIHVYVTNISLPSEKEMSLFKELPNNKWISESVLIYRFMRDYLVGRLSSIVIQGISGVTDVDIARQPNDSEKWMIHTLNGDYSKLISLECVDFTRSVCNHTIMIYRSLGISAACESIYQQLKEIVLSSGSTIHPAHLRLLADSMCARGYPLSISRYSMAERGAGIMAQASFEEIINTFTLASVKSARDELTGVSSRVAMGQLINAGTGPVEIITLEASMDPLSKFIYDPMCNLQDTKLPDVLMNEIILE